MTSLPLPDYENMSQNEIMLGVINAVNRQEKLLKEFTEEIRTRNREYDEIKVTVKRCPTCQGAGHGSINMWLLATLMAMASGSGVGILKGIEAIVK